MRKLLSIIVIGLLFAVNIYAEPRFEEDGTCYKCKGKGEYKNYDYNRKKMGSRKFIKCADCNGTGKKPRTIDGKLLITKNRRRYKEYTIKNIDAKGITIIYKYGLGTKEALIKPKYWPKNMQADIAKRLYMDSTGKMYGSLPQPRNPKCKVGNAFIYNGTPNKNISMMIRETHAFIELINRAKHNLKYGYQQKMALLIVGKIGKMSYTAEILSNPTEEQLKAYFSGKPIKK